MESGMDTNLDMMVELRDGVGFMKLLAGPGPSFE